MATSSCTLKILQLIFLQFLLLKIVLSDSHLNFVFTLCDNDKGNYTQNSVYKKNLNQVISDLGKRDSFYNSIAIGESPNIVYGVFYCMAYIIPKLCRDCVKTAAQIANRPIAGLEEPNEDIYYAWWFSSNNVSNPRKLQGLLSTTMGNLIQKAAYNSTYFGYATGEVPFPPYPTLYCFVQCSPYILAQPCERCLNGIFNDMKSCCNGGRIWLMMFRPNCQMRYDMVPFYKLSAPSSSPPASSAMPANDKGVLFYVTRVGVAAVVVILILLIAAAFILCSRMKRQRPTGNDNLLPSHKHRIIEVSGNAESFQYSFETIRTATQNFSNDNKLGEGGFGAVYKGKLPDGQDVAVKRLSENSCQGLREFTTEVEIVAKLQHRNLVRLLGFCLEGEEKLLVYEFVSNLSLDRLLFDPNKRQYLDWETRIKIILGIARGLLYLHQDSRLKIVHRDMKSSNILLDQDMITKIADFGTAKLMKIDHTQAHTTKIFGTFGYMAPEYLGSGTFSIKSDVYSFGVILLEIISAQKNNIFSHSIGKESLISYARRLWNTEAILELVDPSLESNFSSTEVLRCIQVGLLCVQDDPSSRPTMETVLHILNNNSSDIQLTPESSHTNLGGELIAGEAEQYDINSGNNTQQLKELYPR